MALVRAAALAPPQAKGQNMRDSILMNPIGVVRSIRTAPIEDDWDAVEARERIAGYR
jgi:hypothetical protein